MIKAKQTSLSLVVTIVVGVTSIIYPWSQIRADEAGEPSTVSPSRDWLGGISHAPTEDWAVAFGGRLYDNWAQATFVSRPDANHPAYPKWGKKKGYSTWLFILTFTNYQHLL
jgi:hypothetical protein